MVLLRARTPDWRGTLNKQEPRTPFIIDQNTGNISHVDMQEEKIELVTIEIEQNIIDILNYVKSKAIKKYRF